MCAVSGAADVSDTIASYSGTTLTRKNRRFRPTCNMSPIVTPLTFHILPLQTTEEHLILLRLLFVHATYLFCGHRYITHQWLTAAASISFFFFCHLPQFQLERAFRFRSLLHSHTPFNAYCFSRQCRVQLLRNPRRVANPSSYPIYPQKSVSAPYCMSSYVST